MYARAIDDPDALRAILADDVRWEAGHTAELLGQPEVSIGPDAVLEFFRRWLGAFDDWGFDYDQIAEDGDRVIAHIRQWGTGRTSGVRVENSFWQVWHMRDGKAVRGCAFETREEAMAAPAA